MIQNIRNPGYIATGIVLLLLCFLAGCKEISFPGPQPKGRKELAAVPRQIQGKFLPMEKNGTLSQDTIIIDAHGYRFGYYDMADRMKADNDDDYETGTLGDSLVLKSFKGYYFFNFHEYPTWIVRIVKPEKSGDLIYMAPEQEDVDFKDYLKKITAYIPVDSFEVKGQMYYQVDPSPNELIKLIEKGFFSETRLKKVADQ